jgi:hypothetical protein
LRRRFHENALAHGRGRDGKHESLRHGCQD